MLRVREARQRDLGQRVDRDDLAAAARRGLQRRQHARVVGARVLADDEDDVGVLEIVELNGPLADADRLLQRDAAGLVTQVRAVGQVVGAELAHEQLIEERRLVAGAPGRVEGRLLRALERGDCAGDARERIVPRDRLIVRAPFGQPHRLDQAPLLAEPVVVSGRQVGDGCGARRTPRRRARDRPPRRAPSRRSRRTRSPSARPPAAPARRSRGSRSRPAGSSPASRARRAAGRARAPRARRSPRSPPRRRRRQAAASPSGPARQAIGVRQARDPSGAAVDVEAAVAHEPQQRHARRRGPLDSQAGRRARPRRRSGCRRPPPSGPARSWRARSASARPPSPAASPRAVAGPPACRRRCGAPRPRGRPPARRRARTARRRAVRPCGRTSPAPRAASPGSPWITAAVTRASPPAAVAQPLASPSRSARPQTPHAALVTNARALAASAAAADGASSIRTLSSPSCSAPRSAPTPASTPSACKKPTASATSSPGVRIVVDSARSSSPIRTLICSGRSIATRSRTAVMTSPRTRITDVSRAWSMRASIPPDRRRLLAPGSWSCWPC